MQGIVWWKQKLAVLGQMDEGFHQVLTTSKLIPCIITSLQNSHEFTKVEICILHYSGLNFARELMLSEHPDSSLPTKVGSILVFSFDIGIGQKTSDSILIFSISVESVQFKRH